MPSQHPTTNFLLRIAAGSAFALTLLCHTGCQSMSDSTRTSMRHFTRQFTPSPHDYRDATGESEDQWQDFTREARAAHVAEKDPDPWYRRWFMSEKARQTESHLGVN